MKRFSTLLMCALFLLSTAACATKEEKVAKFISRGDRYIQNGDPVRAVVEYKNALQIDPQNANARFLMGKAYLQKKDYLPAFRSLSEALELDPGLDEARLEVAAMLVPGTPQAALDELNKIRQPEAFELRIAITRARALMGVGRHREAVEIVKSPKEGPVTAEVQRILALCLEELNDFKGMEEAAEKARALEPQNPFSYLLLARYAARHGDTGRIVREMDSLVKANPDPSLALMRARSFESFGLLEKAKEAFASLPGDPEMVKSRADFEVRQGNIEAARHLIEGILSQSPSDADARLRLVALLQAEGKTSTALEEIETGIKKENKQPQREKFILAKAEIKARQNEIEEAAQICKDILNKNQGNSDAHLLMGKLLLNIGKTEEAEIHLNQAASARPNEAEPQILLARSQILNKKNSLAKDTLNSALRANRGSDELRLEYVRMCLVSKEMDQAIQVLDQGLQANPENLALLETRGNLFASRSEFVKAERDFLEMEKLAPKAAPPCVLVGKLMAKRSMPDKAIDWLKKGLAREVGWETAIPVLVEAYGIKGDLPAGLAVVEAEVARREPSPSAFYILGRVYSEVGKFREAEKYLSKASQLAPQSVEIQRAIADNYIIQGETDSAISKLEEIYRANPSSSTSMALAVLYEHKGKHDEASRLLEELVKTSKFSPAVMNDLAYIYAENRTDEKDLERAANLIAQALVRQPENPAFLDTAAWIAFKQGKMDLAWYQIQYALALQPDAGFQNLHAAFIAKAKGEGPQALQYLGKALQGKLDAASRKNALELKRQLQG